MMGKTYTRTGDKGTTAIHGGIRVPKTDIRIEVNGTVDELNVAVGNLRCMLKDDHRWQDFLNKIQTDLMIAMSIIATPSDMRENNPNRLSPDLVSAIENEIDRINELTSPSTGFILPAGSPLSVAFHQARVMCRKAERRLWQLNDIDPVPEIILQYFNRLSDLFFVMARLVLLSEGKEEQIWKKFGYKKSSR